MLSNNLCSKVEYRIIVIAQNGQTKRSLKTEVYSPANGKTYTMNM